MKTTIDYSNLPEKEKEEKALKDCQFYLETKLFKKVINCLKPLKIEFQARFSLEMVGICGFPATILIKKYCPEIKLKENEENRN